MNAVAKKLPWKTKWVSGKCDVEPPTYEAAEILRRMADCAWHCGDPGVQYDTTINNWHTCPNSGRINASNHAPSTCSWMTQLAIFHQLT